MRTSRGRRQALDCPFKPNIVIDSKALWSKKNTAQIRMIINQEPYGSNWHLREADQLGEALDSLKLDLHDSTEEEKNIIGKERNKRPILLDEEESLKRKQKGAKISYWEKVYLYTLMKKDKMSKRVLASKYNLSLGALYRIINEFDSSTPPKYLDKSGWNRSIIASPKIRSAIKDYLWITRTPWIAKDIVEHLKSKMGILIAERTVRLILLKVFNMSYKKGLSRMINFDETWQSWAKQLFSIKLWKPIEKFDMLINVYESFFSRLTKKELTWILKGRDQIVKNICFKNSWSLVTAITSTGGVIIGKVSGSVDSNLIEKFMKEMVSFIKDSEGAEVQRSLVILDNASIHHAKVIKDYLNKEGLNVAYIPQYSPEMAPVEHYFSKLKQTVINKARGKSIDWRSHVANSLLRDCISNIHPEMIRSIWTSFTKEIYRCLDCN